MNAVVERFDPVDHYQAMVRAAHPHLSGAQAGWLVEQRARALEHFMRTGFPTRDEEAWRYTGLETVLQHPWQILSEPAVAVKAADIEHLWVADNAAARLVFIDGRWQRALSSAAGDDCSGIQLRSLREALEESPDRLRLILGKAAEQAVSAFGALNTALLDDGAWVQFAAGTSLSGPVEILWLSAGRETAAIHPRNLLVLEEGAEAAIIEHYASLNQTPCFTNSLTEIRLGRRARLEHLRLQDESCNARHFGSICIEQGEGSHLRATGASLGGAWARCEYYNRLQRVDASCDIDGLYVADNRRLTDVHLEVDHVAPACHSRLRFKGILTGKGRAVFDGLIRVRTDAQKTEAHLSDDNLMLSRSAEVDTKPQLEIYADDVKCSHGTTVGQLDAEQLFYLRSRGVGADAARRMLCLGFAAEVLQGCSVDGFRKRVEQRLKLQLDDGADDRIEE